MIFTNRKSAYTLLYQQVPNKITGNCELFTLRCLCSQVRDIVGRRIVDKQKINNAFKMRIEKMR